MGEERAPRSAGCSRTNSFLRVLWRHVRQPKWMLSVTHRRGPPIGGAGAREKSGHRERGTRWRCKHSHIVPIRAALQQPFVDGIDQNIMCAASAMSGTANHTIRDDPITL
eukprot:2151016-Pleurochrysis_carterae.AAC.1